MMKNRLYHPIVLGLIASFACCTNQKSPAPSADYMILEEVTYVDQFPRSISLQNEMDVDIDIIGIKDFVIHDSLLIAATGAEEGLWSVVALPDYTHLGSFLKRGQGPFEFSGLPFVSQQTLSSADGLSAYIYDFQRGELLGIDVGQSIVDKALHVSKQIDSLPPFLFNFVRIDSNRFFCKEVDVNRQQHIRYLLKNGKEETLPVLTALNQARIRQGEDINILSTLTKYGKTADRMVEAPIGLNYINIYSLDGSFGKTVCIGKELFNINKAQDTDREKRIYAFSDVRIFDDFFGLVYADEERTNYLDEPNKTPKILLFDWDGNPLAELVLRHQITSFDIDFSRGELYTFDFRSDAFYKYDFKDKLTEIGPQKGFANIR